MEEELNFENNKEIDFDFNKKESKYKSDKKVKVEFDLQFILDYLHKKKMIVFEGDAKKEIGDFYGLELNTDKYYYVSLPITEVKPDFLGTLRTTFLEKKESVLEVFKTLLYQDLENLK